MDIFLRAWHEHFLQNRLAPDKIPWDSDDCLTAEERRIISKSIAAFQLGEQSEGKGLMKAADDFSRSRGNPDLPAITRLFIAEEQNHALLLKRFMTRHGIACITRNWTDRVFRRLRKNASYELSLTVLTTAEVISLVYYKALRGATDSHLLKRICDKILADEIAHVKFESDVLSHIRAAKNAISRWARVFFHQFLLVGTITVVYWTHRRVLDRGGYEFTRFFAACWLEFSDRFGSAAVYSARRRSLDQPGDRRHREA